MSTIEFLFSEPSAMFERLTAPKRMGSGKYQLSATLAVHFDPGDASVNRLDAVLPLVAEVADRLFEADEKAPVHTLTMTAAPRDEVRLRLREFDALAEDVVEGGAELVTTAVVQRIKAEADQSGVGVAVTLRFEVRADQVAELVRLLGATRAKATGEQLELLPGGVESVTITTSHAGERKSVSL